MSYTFLPDQINDDEESNQYYLNTYGVTYQKYWVTDSFGQSQFINTDSYSAHNQQYEQQVSSCQSSQNLCDNIAQKKDDQDETENELINQSSQIHISNDTNNNNNLQQNEFYMANDLNRMEEELIIALENFNLIGEVERSNNDFNIKNNLQLEIVNSNNNILLLDNKKIQFNDDDSCNIDNNDNSTTNNSSTDHNSKQQQFLNDSKNDSDCIGLLKKELLNYDQTNTINYKRLLKQKINRIYKTRFHKLSPKKKLVKST